MSVVGVGALDLTSRASMMSALRNAQGVTMPSPLS